ncbi:aminotransferase class III-fold pyridoxal phosphate-dependent enzyme [Bacillus mycoides]|uniref:aminotransferase class III-fold pyridoxal phosphate-dependent enzyme n=1 Tax=Bacillus mycoides TaxID=1405 RepID=UPI00339BD91A
MKAAVEETTVLKVTDELKDIVHMISGMEKEEMDENKNLISYGLDSILLMTLAKQLHTKYYVEIPLDVFFTTLNTLQLVAEYIAEHGVVSDVQEEEPESEEIQEEETFVEASLETNKEADIMAEETYTPEAMALNSNEKTNLGMLVKVFNGQYEIMVKQNEILKVMASGSAVKKKGNGQKNREVKGKVKNPVLKKSEDYFKPYKKLALNQTSEVDDLQFTYIKNIEKRVNALTANSKDATQKFRSVYASNRNSAGFRPLYKEMLYQIIAEEGKGSKIVDIDGNEMIDLTMGFGVLMFGHGPEFIREALRGEIEKGLPLGPMGRLTGQVAKNISELTGVERVFFCNSGTEADMFAVRVARAVTKKDKVVCFTGSYHGTYDGFLGTTNYSGVTNNSTISLVPGITDNAVKDIIYLDYNSEASISYIEEHSDIIAAVLTEPVQSRRPDVQSGEFLKKLRKVTEEHDIALIFDEIITGFRIASGGAQEYFDVEADIVTYGKVIGGGMPIGVLAGKRKYLDSIDGGMWNFGDGSVPPVEDKRTFVAGTFCHHPMAMAATNAVLEYIKKNKDSIYEHLNQKTTKFVNELNQFFVSEGVDIHINQFGSLFRFAVNLEKEIFYYGLLEKGIYIWEGRNCFLSTEHSKEDVDYIIDAVKKTIFEMKQAGFFNKTAF